jgi:hypothetical protein
MAAFLFERDKLAIYSPCCKSIILKTAVNAGGFAQFFGRLWLALSAPRTARCASGKRKPQPSQNLAQTHPAELPFLGLFVVHLRRR